MNQEQIAQLLQEFLTRRNLIDRLLADLTPFQRKVITTPGRYKALLCSRRAGKSRTSVTQAILTAIEYPKSISVYIGLKRANAKDVCWNLLKQLSKEYNLGCTFSETELICTFPNGSQVWLKSGNDSKVIEGLRGSKYKLAILDECASYGSWLDYLIEDILEPALQDQEGSVLLAGTPGKTLAGLFYDVTNDEAVRRGHTQGYLVFKGTLLDNPMFDLWKGKPNWQDIAKQHLLNVLKIKGITAQDPGYQREYEGRWVHDDSLNPYIIPDAAHLPAGQIPPTNLSYVLGIDLGYNDESAYVVLGYDPYVQKVYEVYSFSRPRMNYTEIIQEAANVINQYKPELVVVDPGAGGKNLTAELQCRYDFPCLSAQKEKKGSFMRLWATDMMTSRMLFLNNSNLSKQLKSITWNKSRTLEQEGIPADLHDAGLYAWRACMHWIAQYKPAIQTEEERMLEASIREMEYDPLFPED